MKISVLTSSFLHLATECMKEKEQNLVVTANFQVAMVTGICSAWH